MSLQSFTLFPKLPPEVRDMIWGCTIQPRLVRVRETSSTRAHQAYMSPDESHHQYSDSPIPYSLHTCRESRASMIKYGYVLTFGTSSQEPQTWFNFKCDVLYLQPYVWEYYYYNNTRHFNRNWHWSTTSDGNWHWFLERISREDASRVKRVAFAGSLSRGKSFGPFTGNFSLVLERFNALQDLLMVETVRDRFAADGSTVLEDMMDLRKFPPVWIECDVAEAQGHCVSDGRNLTLQYSQSILAYKERNRCDGQAFFRDTAQEFERELSDAKDAAQKHADSGLWLIPKVKIVQVMSEYCAARLIFNRDRYWAQVAEEEQNRIADEFLARPLSPFSMHHADEIEVINGR